MNTMDVRHLMAEKDTLPMKNFTKLSLQYVYRVIGPAKHVQEPLMISGLQIPNFVHRVNLEDITKLLNN